MPQAIHELIEELPRIWAEADAVASRADHLQATAFLWLFQPKEGKTLTLPSGRQATVHPIPPGADVAAIAILEACADQHELAAKMRSRADALEIEIKGRRDH